MHVCCQLPQIHRLFRPSKRVTVIFLPSSILGDSIPSPKRKLQTRISLPDFKILHLFQILSKNTYNTNYKQKTITIKIQLRDIIEYSTQLLCISYTIIYKTQYTNFGYQSPKIAPWSVYLNHYDIKKRSRINSFRRKIPNQLFDNKFIFEALYILLDNLSCNISANKWRIFQMNSIQQGLQSHMKILQVIILKYKFY